MTSVVVARPADRGQILSTVVSAFKNDPAWAFICGADYDRIAPLFCGALLDARVADGTVWMTADGAAVSMWDGPGIQAADRSRPWAEFRRQAGEEVWERLSRYDTALSACRPREPIWYLGVLACDAARRNEGLATAAMQPGLESADRAALAACLETSTSQNKDFYVNRGFTEGRPVDVVDGPPTWWLTRQPGGR